MTELLRIGIVPLLLTLGAYRLGLWCQKKLKTPVANPILISVILVLLFFAVTGMELKEYQAGMASISWLITPATVCLAIPMYEQFRILRKNLPAILAGVSAGAVSCLFMVLGFSMLLRFDPALTISLLPKSVTSAIGAPLSQMYGGAASITTSVIILSGILASILGNLCCRLFRLTDPIAKGVAFGTAGHVIATAKATEISALTGATGSLALVIAGLLTAVIFPVVIKLV